MEPNHVMSGWNHTKLVEQTGARYGDRVAFAQGIPELAAISRARILAHVPGNDFVGNYIEETDRVELFHIVLDRVIEVDYFHGRHGDFVVGQTLTADEMDFFSICTLPKATGENFMRVVKRMQHLWRRTESCPPPPRGWVRNSADGERPTAEMLEAQRALDDYAGQGYDVDPCDTYQIHLFMSLQGKQDAIKASDFVTIL